MGVKSKEKKYRIPRKVKKKIPRGPYCYKGISFDSEKFIYHIKPCPFYTFKLNEEFDYMVGWCNLIKYEIDDQCKSCGINDYKCSIKL